MLFLLRRRSGAVRIIGCILILVVVIIIVPALYHYGRLCINGRVAIGVIIRRVRIAIAVGITVTETEAAIVAKAQT